MHVFKQLCNWIPEIITVTNEKVDLEVDDVVNNYENVFHLYMTFIIGSILRKSTSQRMFMSNLTVQCAFELNNNI